MCLMFNNIMLKIRIKYAVVLLRPSSSCLCVCMCVTSCSVWATEQFRSCRGQQENCWALLWVLIMKFDYNVHLAWDTLSLISVVQMLSVPCGGEAFSAFSTMFLSSERHKLRQCVGFKMVAGAKCSPGSLFLEWKHRSFRWFIQQCGTCDYELWRGRDCEILIMPSILENVPWIQIFTVLMVIVQGGVEGGWECLEIMLIPSSALKQLLKYVFFNWITEHSCACCFMHWVDALPSQMDPRASS